MAERTIRHALFSYVKDGRQRIARRGDTVDLSAEDIARGERDASDSAFMAQAGDEPPPLNGSELGDFPSGGTAVEQDAWVDSAKVGEALAWANANPADARPMLEAEERRGDKMRSTLTEPLAKLIAAQASA